MIVEVGDGSLGERFESLQSELAEASTETGSCRSLSEGDENETGEPSFKRLKTQVRFVIYLFYQMMHKIRLLLQESPINPLGSRRAPLDK